jgi:peptide/nickel transport system ATP-binding protein
MASSVSSAVHAAGISCAIRGLTVAYRVGGQEFPAVRDVDLDIPSGEVTAVIGESGSGKTTLAMAMLNGVQPPGRIVAGSVMYENAGDILLMEGRRLQRLRGDHVSMVFQTAQNSLNPLKRIGGQVLDLARSHGRKDTKAVLHEARTLCARMSLNAERVLTSYQHELSGGMRQRVGIMLALVLRPKVVLLDEPTTALDVLSGRFLLDALRAARDAGKAILFSTHVMGEVDFLCDRVVLLHQGAVLDQGPIAEVCARAGVRTLTEAFLHYIPSRSV